MTFRLFALTLFAMLAFAGNSLLCRIALKQTAIDPTTFVAIRIVSGALMLWLVLAVRRQSTRLEGTWAGAFALLAYAMAFSYAYTHIPAGTGALLLFGAIQISMILYGLTIGERLSPLQCAGMALAVTGLVALMLPTADAPPVFYGVLMILSGVAWSIYSLLGRSAKNPAAATAGNFIRAAPVALALLLVQFVMANVRIDIPGAVYAVASGAVTSGLGYILWYAALKQLNVTRAATVQLSVPVLAALGGTLFLDEPLTALLVAASALVLAGVSLVIVAKRRV
ncbi:DMT family transporter [Achromobacter spanius]|uniref:DMT family transporter n=1 Tax=Achromobacter spanius TaxID=217203 RepID=UPI003818F7CB